MKPGGILGVGLGLIGIVLSFFFILQFMFNNASEVADKEREIREGKEITIYEIHHQVLDWNLKKEETFLTLSKDVSLDTSKQTFNESDYRMTYLKSDKDYSYFTIVELKNKDNESIDKKRYVLSLTEDDLKKFSKDYSSEFEDTIHIEDYEYDGFINELMGKRENVEYTLKSEEFIEEATSEI